MSPWLLPRAWRTGQQKWTPEAAEIARLIASDGHGAPTVAREMQLLGIPVGAATVDNWLHPRRRAA